MSLEYAEIATRIARQVGWPSTLSDRSADQIARIDECIQSGYRKFLYPAQVPGFTQHEWSFLRPVTTLATVASDFDYTLPDGFGYIEGDFTFATSDSQIGPIRKVGEGEIRARRELNSGSTGVPQLYAIRPLNLTTSLSAGQRFEAIFWPTPNAVYTLSYRYTALPGKLTTLLPYPLGGMQHSETILASCQAQAEKDIDDVQNGSYFQEFARLLQVSINIDRIGSEREWYGYNGDNSDRRLCDDLKPPISTHNGVYSS